MKQLKKTILKYFILITLLAALLESAVNGIFDQVILPAAKENSGLFTLALFGDFLSSLVILFSLALFYCKIVSKKIDEETSRQLDERNLLYSNIIHDLKTPMTSILGFARALMDEQVDGKQEEQVYEIIYEKAKHTDELVNQLFNYTKLQNKDYVLKRQRHDLCAMLRSVVADAYLEFEAREMEVELDLPDTRVYAEVDEIEFRRVLTNLVVNSYKHNLNGTKVGFMIRPSEHEVQIVIADTGNVIPEAIKATIFEPFVCADESRTIRNGSGLGLAVAKSVVAKHGGSLEIKESLSGYTKGFVINLKM